MHEKLDDLEGRVEDLGQQVKEAKAGRVRSLAQGLIIGVLVALTAVRVIKRRNND